MAMRWNGVTGNREYGEEEKMIYGSVDVQSAVLLTVLALAAGAAIYVKRHWKEIVSGWKEGKDAGKIKSGMVESGELRYQGK